MSGWIEPVQIAVWFCFLTRFLHFTKFWVTRKIGFFHFINFRVDDQSRFSTNPGSLKNEQHSGRKEYEERPVFDKPTDESLRQIGPDSVVALFLAFPSDSDSHSTEFVGFVIWNRDWDAVVVENRGHWRGMRIRKSVEIWIERMEINVSSKDSKLGFGGFRVSIWKLLALKSGNLNSDANSAVDFVNTYKGRNWLAISIFVCF